MALFSMKGWNGNCGSVDSESRDLATADPRLREIRDPRPHEMWDPETVR